MTYGECDCGKWGEAPKTFDERKHFLKCPACGKPMSMYLMHGETPSWLTETNEVEITEFIKHKG